MLGLILLNFSLLFFINIQIFCYVSIWGLSFSSLFSVLYIYSSQFSFSIFNEYVSADTMSILLVFFIILDFCHNTTS